MIFGFGCVLSFGGALGFGSLLSFGQVLSFGCFDAGLGWTVPDEPLSHEQDHRKRRCASPPPDGKPHF